MVQRKSEYERRENDLYETPDWVTNAVMKHLYVDLWNRGKSFPNIWEPAAGNMKMVRAIQGWGACHVLASDIDSRGHSDINLFDFLQSSYYDDLHAIITNPPFGKLGQKFVEHALYCTKFNQGLVAMLLPIDFDSAKTRRHLFADCPAWCKKIVLTKRIVWFEPPPGEKGKSPASNHAWYIWDWRHEGPPTIAYS